VWTIYKKEIRSFLSSLIAYVVMVVFLTAIGLFMWMIKGTTVFDLGVAGMDVLFQFAPLVFVFLVSAVTMKSFAEEKRLGTLETLTTHPVSDWGIIFGKFLAALSLLVFSLIPHPHLLFHHPPLGRPSRKPRYRSNMGQLRRFDSTRCCLHFHRTLQQRYDRQPNRCTHSQHESLPRFLPPIRSGG
jgi:hypothetical protein